MKSGYSLVGIVEVTVREADGTVASKQVFNTITNYCRSSLAQWISGTSTATVAPPTKIGAGNGTPPYGQSGALPTDTALWAPITGTLKVCDTIQVSQGYYAQYNLAYQTTDPAGFYNELGLFDAAGNLWAHVAINQFKSSSQTLTAQWMVYMVADTTNFNTIITNYMRTAFASWMTGTSNVSGQPGAIVPPTKIQVGTGTGTPQPSDTALWTPTTGMLKACDMTYISALYNVQFAVTYQNADPTGNFTESGWLDVNNNLWMHGKITANKQSPNLMSVVGQVGIVGN